jgi:hypothetical protein
MAGTQGQGRRDGGGTGDMPGGAPFRTATSRGLEHTLGQAPIVSSFPRPPVPVGSSCPRAPRTGARTLCCLKR